MWSVVCDGVFMHIELNCWKVKSDCLSAYVETCRKILQMLHTLKLSVPVVRPGSHGGS